ncbi:MAG: hypothetical protein U0M66_02725 [Bacilli bacterium]|nr:hypothetical protein [Bacilli bacterium]
MPELTDEQVKDLLEQIKKNSIPLSLNVSKENEEKALKECDEYIKTGNKNINDMTPLTIYYIISKLPEERQITFLKENIKYIKEHDKDIFLYTMMAPESLSYFLSFNVLKELRNIDVEIFKKVISQNPKNLFHGFTYEDYYSFYNQFYTDLIGLENREFINGLYFHNRCCYENFNINDVNNVFQQQRVYNEEFMNYILDMFIDKINTFNPRQLLSFLKYIENIEVYKEFVNKHCVKLNIAFDNIDEYDLKEYLRETDSAKQEILISKFFENIIKKQELKKIISKISPKIIIELYSKNKEVFNPLTLNDWVKLCSKTRTFNDSFKNILDTFEIGNIEELFDTKFYTSYWHKGDVSALRYIETKYRDNIINRGVLEEIDATTSIFSKKYLNNLSELKEMMQNNTISKNDKSYKQHLSNFILFLKNQNIINNIENNNFKEIEKLFYRIVMGKSITILYQLSSIEEITIFNRLGQIDFKVEDFTVEQLENYNVKQHKQLCKKFEKSDWHFRSYKQLILKLMLMVGFNNARALLEIDDTLPVLEHLVGNVDVKSVKLDEQCNPILNTKLMNLLFSDKDYSKMKEMLSNKDNDLYKYFPRIFSEWEMIVMNDKDKSLKIIIDFLKSDEISLPPKYYRLEGLFKFIGCSNSNVNETLLLHDQMLTRESSTIPRIKGTKNEYSYEILRLDDMEALAIGNKTDCCFTVLGNGYSCLKHSLTSNNGRILVVKKDNEILAHSWIWRNGGLLSLDNIEISKKINSVDFFDIYLQIADELIKISYQSEGIESCIKNITIGFTNFDKEIKGIEQYPCLIAKTCNLEDEDFGSRLGSNRKFVDVLPQPIEEVGYSDSKNVQYLIRGNGIFNLGQGYLTYQDERKDIMYYSEDESYEEDYIKVMNRKVNALRYVKAEKDNTLESYKVIDVEDLKEVYCNDDWYVISYTNGDIEIFNNSSDERANNEISSISLKNGKTLKKVI